QSPRSPRPWSEPTPAEGPIIEGIIDSLAGLPPVLLYVAIGFGAAIENIVLPVPADTFVLLGPFLAAAGHADLWLVFGSTFLCNVASATLPTGWRAATAYGASGAESVAGSSTNDSSTTSEPST